MHRPSAGAGDCEPSGALAAARARIAELEGAAADRERTLAGMLAIASNLGKNRDPHKAMRKMVAAISDLLDADRTTIYELDRRENMLRGLAVQGEMSTQVGVLIGKGVAGLVAKRGRTINLKDAYLHPAFDPRFDKLTGYRTRSMLCVPMSNSAREIIGVVQVLNKKRGYFTVEDEGLLTALAAQAAITLEALHLQVQLNIRNAELHGLSEQLKQRVRELELLHGIEVSVHEADDVESMVDTVLGLAVEATRTGAVALFLPDETGGGPVYFRRAGARLSLLTLPHVQVGEGVLGVTAGRGEGMVVDDENRAGLGVELAVGGGHDFEVRDAVTTPLLRGDETIGALALINRDSPDRREDADDVRLALLVAGQLARGVVHLRERQSAQVRDRLMTIGQMLSGVLHDLRGPMTIISGYSQLMARIDDPEERGELADAIRRQVAWFNDMTREVMSFVRGDRTVLVRRVHLRDFVRKAREVLAPEFNRRSVEFEVVNDAGEIGWFDEPKMLRVVTNIARNAAQALVDRGTFVWRLSNDAHGHLVFEFSDDGPGIPEAIRDRVFEVFTSSGKANGTGLGLAIVKRIVDSHDGQITVTTGAGEGTRLTVQLPAREITEAGAPG